MVVADTLMFAEELTFNEEESNLTVCSPLASDLTQNYHSFQFKFYL